MGRWATPPSSLPCWLRAWLPLGRALAHSTHLRQTWPGRHSQKSMEQGRRTLRRTAPRLPTHLPTHPPAHCPRPPRSCCACWACRPHGWRCSPQTRRRLRCMCWPWESSCTSRCVRVFRGTAGGGPLCTSLLHSSAQSCTVRHSSAHLLGLERLAALGGSGRPRLAAGGMGKVPAQMAPPACPVRAASRHERHVPRGLPGVAPPA